MKLGSGVTFFKVRPDDNGKSQVTCIICKSKGRCRCEKLEQETRNRPEWRRVFAGVARMSKLGNAGERRLQRRYNVCLAVHFRVFNGGTLSRWRTGETCDMSTEGLKLQYRQPLKSNALLEMVVDWPVKQADLYPIWLRAVGRVVRSHAEYTAVRMHFCEMITEKVTTQLADAASNS
jgi:hypothetical protein